MTPAPFDLPAGHPDFFKRLLWDSNHDAVVCSACVDADPRTCRNHDRCAADQWTVKVYEAARPLRSCYDNSLIELAIERLGRGDVSRTQHGIRVALHPDHDNRVEANAYWPDEGCRCYYAKSQGICSHKVAALLLELAFPC